MQNKLSTELLSGYFEYRYADHEIIILKKNAMNKRIEMWVGKN
jgi:hypothetical protein